MPSFDTKRDGFLFFGATQRNEQWSWSAKTPNGNKIIITIWQHEMMGRGEDQYLDTRELENDNDEWLDSNGNRERRGLLKHAQDELDGIVYILMTRATNVEAGPPWEIGSCYSWEMADGRVNRMKLTFLDEETGHFRVEYLDSVPLN